MHLGLSGQKICEAQSQQQYFLLVGTDIAFVVKNSTLCSAVAFTDEGLGIDPIQKKYTFFSPTLDGSASILRPK